jgi:hypothetical protein
MALINCKECKKKVSSAALCCPYCGISLPGILKPSRVTVRRKRQLISSFLPMNIYINNDDYMGKIIVGTLYMAMQQPSMLFLEKERSAFGVRKYLSTLGKEIFTL